MEKNSFSKRLVCDDETLSALIAVHRRLGQKIVLLSGTFDLFHIGHARYLEKAKVLGDLLIVGVDSDEKVSSRKGPSRPVVPQEERLEILCHTRHVDFVFLKELSDPPKKLIKLVRPDVLVLSATTKSHSQSEIDSLKEFCKEVVILDAQATASTTARIRLVLIDIVDKAKAKLTEVIAWLDQIGGKV